MIWILYIACAIAAAYQVVALVAVARQLLARERGITRFPKVSILKPVHGRDPFFEDAIGSHMRIDYPDYEVLFCVADPHDEAVPAVRQLKGAVLHVTNERTPNAKVASMIELSRHAHGTVFIVNDGDIRVTPDYLRRVVAPLENPEIGMVTCLYRPIPEGLPAAWEALGIATDFAPSALVAPLVGIDEFGLGSTLCFRVEDLRAIGGFEAVAGYLADDYQLASRITRQLGKRAVMSKLVVDTSIGYRDWHGAWMHQVRWARTIRVSRGDGYLGLPVTHAGLWALLALLCGQPQLAAALAAVRILTGFCAGYVLLRAPVALALPLIPVWDVFAFFVWLAGLHGDTVEWRGRRQKLARDGRLTG